MENDYREGLMTEHQEAIREERLITGSIRRDRVSNMDDYPEFYYG